LKKLKERKKATEKAEKAAAVKAEKAAIRAAKAAVKRAEKAAKAKKVKKIEEVAKIEKAVEKAPNKKSQNIKAPITAKVIKRSPTKNTKLPIPTAIIKKKKSNMPKDIISKTLPIFEKNKERLILEEVGVVISVGDGVAKIIGLKKSAPVNMLYLKVI